MVFLNRLVFFGGLGRFFWGGVIFCLVGCLFFVVSLFWFVFQEKIVDIVSCHWYCRAASVECQISTDGISTQSLQISLSSLVSVLTWVRTENLFTESLRTSSLSLCIVCILLHSLYLLQFYFFPSGRISKLYIYSDRMYVNICSSVNKCWKFPSPNALSWENKAAIPGKTWEFLQLSTLVIKWYCLNRFLCLHLYFADKLHGDMVKGTNTFCKPVTYLLLRFWPAHSSKPRKAAPLGHSKRNTQAGHTGHKGLMVILQPWSL